MCIHKINADLKLVLIIQFLDKGLSKSHRDSFLHSKNVLQHNATHCNTLQYPATQCTHCNTLHRTATTLQHINLLDYDSFPFRAARTQCNTL